MNSPSDEVPAGIEDPPIDLEAGAGAELESDPGPTIAFIVPAPADFAVDTGASIAPFDPGEILPAADPLAPLTRSIVDLGEGLGRRLDALQTVFDREIRAESTREKVVDRLHTELQEYKQGLILGILRPVFVDLIRLHDDIGKMLGPPADPGADPEPAPRRLLDLMRGYQQEVEDILYRQGVEPFHHEAEAFDPRRQRALSTVPTDDPAQNKMVAARLRKGFQAGDKVIRPEMVTVYAHKPKAPEPGGPASS